MARLHHEPRRPLVVSFRRKKPQFQHTKQVTIFDQDTNSNSSVAAPDAIDSLMKADGGQRMKEVMFGGINRDGDELQSKHVCPLNEAFPLLVHGYRRGLERENEKGKGIYIKFYWFQFYRNMLNK